MRNETNDNSFYESKRLEWDTLLKQGQSRAVLKQYSLLSSVKIPRVYAFQFADLLQRASAPLKALRLINKYIRGNSSDLANILDSEKVTYASCLTSLGCHQEAIALLNSVSTEHHPEADLITALANFGLWNYNGALPKLRKYIANQNLLPYKKLIGKVNLVAALIAVMNFEEARTLLHEAFIEAKANNHRMLLGNLYELESQMLIQEKKFDQARESLDLAERILSGTGIYFYYVKKWQLIIRLLSEPMSADLLAQKEEIEKISIQNKYWEIQRDLDLYHAFALKDLRAAKRVINVTPHQSYHQKAQRLFSQLVGGNKYVLFEKFPLQKMPMRSHARSKLILHMEWNIERAKNLAFHPSLLQAFRILLRDGYRPIGLGELFSLLYPGQHFDPFSSPKRVHNLVYRLRKFIEVKKWPLKVNVSDYEFSLGALDSTNQGIQIVLVQSTDRADSIEAVLASLAQVFGEKKFQTLEASMALQVSKRYLQNTLLKAQQLQKLDKFGVGKKTFYQLKDVQNIQNFVSENSSA